jgi:hypothetical protein
MKGVGFCVRGLLLSLDALPDSTVQGAALPDGCLPDSTEAATIPLVFGWAHFHVIAVPSVPQL